MGEKRDTYTGNETRMTKRYSKYVCKAIVQLLTQRRRERLQNNPYEINVRIETISAIFPLPPPPLKLLSKYSQVSKSQVRN